jgi:transcriptional regulator with XRE-family HTH domain
MPDQTLGDRLRHWREKRGLTQAEVGKLTGLHRNTVARFERGILNPSVQTLARLARALEVSSDVLLGLREDTLEAAWPAGIAIAW